MNKSIKVIVSLFVGFCGLYIFFAPFWLFPINIYYLLPLSVFVALSLGFFYNWIWLFQKENSEDLRVFLDDVDVVCSDKGELLIKGKVADFKLDYGQRLPPAITNLMGGYNGGKIFSCLDGGERQFYRNNISITFNDIECYDGCSN